MIMGKMTVVFAAVTMLAFAVQTKAEAEYITTQDWNFSLSFGYGELQNPIGNTDNVTLYALPNVQFYNERFFIDNTTVGYSLFENNHLYFDIIGQLNDDGLYFNFEDFGVLSAIGLDAARGIDLPNIERDMSYLGGVGFGYLWQDTLISMTWLNDITNTHHGDELTVKVGRQHNFGETLIGLNLSATRKSHDLLSYYYQIEQSESVIFAGTYAPESAGVNYQIHFTIDQPIGRGWFLTGALKRTFLSNQISDSIIIERHHIDNYFAGVKYAF